MIIHEMNQGTPEWFKVKAGVPSSSCFSQIITGTGKPSDSLKKYALKLATEKHLGKSIDDGFSGTKYMDRGTELEPESRADYEMLHQVTIREVGFITDDLGRWGASTDGLVNDDGLTEFKNLISTSMMALLVYLAKNPGKTEPKYIPQIQGELFVTEREWCDIVFYHPDFDPIIHRHYPDLVFQAALKAQLVKVIAERNNILKLVNGE